MVRMEFYICEEDFDRLSAIKSERGRDDLTGNEFARELLEAELHRLHPAAVPARYEDENEADTWQEIETDNSELTGTGPDLFPEYDEHLNRKK